MGLYVCLAEILQLDVEYFLILLPIIYFTSVK